MLSLVEPSALVEIEGTVTRVRRTDDGNGPAGMGIRFDYPDEEQQAAISTLVERALSRTLVCSVAKAVVLG